MSLEDELLDPAMAAALAGDFDRYRKNAAPQESALNNSKTPASEHGLSQTVFEDLLREFAISGSREYRIEHRFPSEAEAFELPGDILCENDPTSSEESSKAFRWTPTPMGGSFTDALAWKSRQMIGELFRWAEQGDHAAARALSMISIDLINHLNNLAKRQPDLFRSLSRHLGAWPVMMSRHPELSEDPRKVLNTVNAGPKVRRRAGEKYGAWLRFRFSGIGGQEFTPPGTSGWAPALPEPKPERSGGAGGGRAGAARHRAGVVERSLATFRSSCVVSSNLEADSSRRWPRGCERGGSGGRATRRSAVRCPSPPSTARRADWS